MDDLAATGKAKPGAASAAPGYKNTASLTDHPYTDPGDGRTECQTCSKWVFSVIHSCKGVPVTDRARARQCPRLVITGNACCGGNGAEASCEVCRRD